jgi:hypothetical protein
VNTSLSKCSTDSDGTTSIAQQGSLLTEARTRPFEVLSHSDYIAARTVIYPVHRVPLMCWCLSTYCPDAMPCETGREDVSFDAESTSESSLDLVPFLFIFVGRSG